MPPRLGWRITAALLPLGLGILGLMSNVSDWRSAETLGQHVAAAGVIAYGPLGVIAAILLLLGKPLGRTVLVWFSATATMVGGLAPVAWGGQSIGIGLLAAFSSAIFCAGAIWAASVAIPNTPAPGA